MEIEKIENSKPEEVIHWHAANFLAIKFEFKSYEASFKIEQEYQLSKEALKIDVVIIKKEKDVRVNKNIGRIFKGHNICEYKSETDNFSVRDYSKINGYARLYSAFNDIDESDITITIIVTRKPVKLMAHLKSLGFEIVERYSGIYYVTGDTFSVQILETKRLSVGDAPFIRSLRSNLTAEELKATLDAYSVQIGGYNKNDAFINTITEANTDTFKEVYSMGAQFDAFVLQVAAEKGWVDVWKAEGMQRGLQEGKQEGIQEGMQKGIQKGMREGIQEGMQKGIQKGMQKGIQEMIIEMKKENCPDDLIARVSKLPLERIKAIQV